MTKNKLFMCPSPYEVFRDKHGITVIEIDGEQIGAYDPVNKPITRPYLAELLNEAYKMGVDDATEVLMRKAVRSIVQDSLEALKEKENVASPTV